MYLGRTLGSFKATDDNTVYAQTLQAPQKLQAPAKPKAPALPQEVSTQVVATPAEASTSSSPQEVTRLRDMNATLRGRVLKLLGVVRDKNRTIARLSTEVETLRTPEQLTVGDILAAQAAPVRR